MVMRSYCFGFLSEICRLLFNFTPRRLTLTMGLSARHIDKAVCYRGTVSIDQYSELKCSSTQLVVSTNRLPEHIKSALRRVLESTCKEVSKLTDQLYHVIRRRASVLQSHAETQTAGVC